MDESSYRNQEVVRLANELFVPIRVNIDRRPDISERYNFGGFPTTAILTAEGETVTGGTYMAPEEMKIWLLSQSEYFRAQKSEIRQRIASFAVEESLQPVPGELSEGIVQDLQQCLLEGFDRVYGGFGTQPKFPHSDAIELALASALSSGGEVFVKMITKTLDEMVIGGLFDRVEGGFHRYSTTRDWASPHFEKILEGNSGLLRNYVRAYKLIGDRKYREIAERTIEYLFKTLLDSGSTAFYGSQAADEEYYSLPKDRRAARDPPRVDKTLYVNWNAHVILSLLEAAPIAPGGLNLLSFCESLANFLVSKGFDEVDGMHHYLDPDPILTGLLVDNLEMASAFLGLHAATGESSYLEKAQELAGIMHENFWDRVDGGGFYDTVPERAAEGHLRRREKNLVQNSLAAEFFLKLSAVTETKEYDEIARKTLNIFTESYSETGLLASSYARSVSLALQGLIRVEIIGSRRDGAFAKFLAAASELLEPRCVVVPLDVDENPERLRRDPVSVSDETYARICVDSTFSAPVRDPSQLRERVTAASRR